MAYSQDFYDRNPRANNGGSMAPIIGAAAVGFAAGMAANMARKAAAQAPAAVKGDWVEALKTEHRIFEKMFETLLDTEDRETGKRTMLLKALKGALSKHDLEESSVIYPALALHGSEAEGRHLASEHADIKTFLMELDMMDKDDTQWIVRARAFHELVQSHVREEEEEIFPALRMRLSKEQNAKLFALTQREAVKLA
jgi:hemerythrin superfamily protein